MNNKTIAIIFLLILLGLNGCPRKKARPVSLKTPKEKEIGVVKELEEGKPVKYVYKGERYRNPFAPAEETGERIGKAGKKGIQIDLSRLKLTGIIISSSTKDRYALIEAGGGRGYIVRGGKLIDNYNDVVEGVAAIIRKDKVILITSDNVIQELTFKTE